MTWAISNKWKWPKKPDQIRGGSARKLPTICICQSLWFHGSQGKSRSSTINQCDVSASLSFSLALFRTTSWVGLRAKRMSWFGFLKFLFGLGFFKSSWGYQFKTKYSHFPGGTGMREVRIGIRSRGTPQDQTIQSICIPPAAKGLSSIFRSRSPDCDTDCLCKCCLPDKL